MDTESKQPALPYVPYQTFKAFIRYLHDTVIPEQIDNTMMPHNFSGSARAAVISALKSLKLIDSQNNTTQKLKELAAAVDTAQWPAQLRANVLSAYDIITHSIVLKSATRGQVEKIFEDASAQMKDKCIRFFLFANKEAAIEYSPHLSIRRRLPRKRTDKATTKRKTGTQGGSEPQGGIPNKEKTPSNAFDQPILIQPLGDFYIRVPNNITVKQAQYVKIAANHIEEIAKQNEGTE
jgi:hypothetical protein